MIKSEGRRQNDGPKGWAHFLYAFGPWAIGGAIVLFSILVVAYENRYRGAVRDEIANRLVYEQETMVREAGHRLRHYLHDMTTRIQLLARLAAEAPDGAPPQDTLHRVATHDLRENYAPGIYIVDRGYPDDPAAWHVLFEEQALRPDVSDAGRDEGLPDKETEIARHLRRYEQDTESPWLMSPTVAMDVGRIGHILSAPIRGSDGTLRGLVAALVPTALEINQIEKSMPDGNSKLWLLTEGGMLLGDRVTPAPTPAEIAPVAAHGSLATEETDGRILTVAPISLGGITPWTLVATQPKTGFLQKVQDEVGGPWTRRLLITVACGNFLGLVVLLTLRHWREQITVLRAQAEHDPLTGAHSRRFLDREAAMLCRRFDRLGVVMVDLNEFKHHNDTLGHHVGDQMLKAAAEVLAGAVRENDFVVRIGGDEFLVLLPLADERLVASVEARIRWALEQWNLSPPIPGARLSFAIGSAAGMSRHMDYLVKQADERMYVDKQRHKDAEHLPATCARDSV